MDAHLFRLFAQAAGPFLEGGRIEKIQEPEQGLITLTIFGRNEKKQLCWCSRKDASFCFLSGARLAANKSPSAQLMRLRKYFSERRIASVVFQYCQRKLWLLAAVRPGEGKEGAVPWLCLDLVKGASLHFLSPDEAPREDDPRWPETSELEFACAHWREWPVLTPLLRKSLALMEEPDRWALMEDLRAASGSLFLYFKKVGNVELLARVSAWPMDLKEGEECRELEREDWLGGFERAGKDLVLRKLHENSQDRLLAPLQKRLGSLRRILAKLDQDEQRLLAMAGQEKDGKILRDNLWHLDGTSHLGELELEDGQKLNLNEKYDLKGNMERFFHSAKRGKRGLEMLARRREALLAEIAGLEKAGGETLPPSDELSKEASKADKKSVLSRKSALQANLPKNVQALFSTDGHILLRGKDAKGNRSALRLAQGHDLWTHVESGQGAHVIIRRKYPGEELSEETLAEAASLAAVKSWHKDEGSCGVMFAEVRHVKGAKNGPPGKVFIDKIFRTSIFQIDADIEGKLSRNEG